MNAFDLLFLAGVLVTLIVLVGALGLTLGGRRRRGGRLLAGLGAGWAAYLVIVAVVAVVTTAPVYAAGQPQCFDDMCFVVTGAARDGDQLKVSMRISNHARRVTEGDGGLRAELWSDGQLTAPANIGPVPLSVRLAPGASAATVLSFAWRPGAHELGVVLDHGLTPGWFIIGECPPGHRPALMLMGVIHPAA